MRSMQKLVSKVAITTMTTALNSSLRRDSCLRLYMVTSPATVCMAMNSNGLARDAAHIMMVMKWVMKAVRESMNILMRRGIMQ